jgi:thioredoxin-like negative regulator of GroEL
MSGGIIELDGSGFKEALKKSKKLVIVEFYSDSCSACRAIAPTYRQLSEELEKFAMFTQVNVTPNVRLSQELGIMGTPTFKFFCSGRPIGEIVGAINATILRNTIKDMVRHKNECITKSTPINYEMDGYM